MWNRRENLWILDGGIDDMYRAGGQMIDNRVDNKCVSLMKRTSNMGLKISLTKEYNNICT